MPTVAKPAKPRPVDFVNDAMCLRAAILGSLGFSTAAITDRCGYTPSQVLYRLKKAGITRAAYRNGGSAMAIYVVRAATAKASDILREQFTKNGKHKSS